MDKEIKISLTQEELEDILFNDKKLKLDINGIKVCLIRED